MAKTFEGRAWSEAQATVATGELSAGWAVEDGVGALFTGGALTEAVTRAPKAHLYRLEPDGNGGAKERGVPCRLLPQTC